VPQVAYSRAAITFKLWLSRQMFRIRKPPDIENPVTDEQYPVYGIALNWWTFRHGFLAVFFVHEKRSLPSKERN
jgi:hypothetical protein